MNQPGHADGRVEVAAATGTLTPGPGAPPASGDRGGGTGLDSRAMAAPATPDEILDVNRRYHDVAAPRVRPQVGHLVRRGRPPPGARQARASCSATRPGPFARSLEIGAGTGYFSLNLLQAGVVGAATCTDISPGMLETLEAQRAVARARGRDRRLRRGRAAVRRRELRPRARPRRPAPPARPRPRVRRVPPRAAPGGTLFFAGEPSRHGDRIAARAQARRAARRAAVAARCCTLRPAPEVAPATTTTRSRRWSTSTPSSPSDLEAGAGAPASRASACAARSCWRTGSAGPTARSRRPPTRRAPAGLDPVRLPRLPALQAVDRRLLEPRLPPHLFYNLMLAARKPGG